MLVDLPGCQWAPLYLLQGFAMAFAKGNNACLLGGAVRFAVC